MKISEDRRDLLQEQVADKFKLMSKDQMKQLSREAIYDQYLPQSNRFNNNYGQNEQNRRDGHDKLVNTLTMSKFLEEVTGEEIH